MHAQRKIEEPSLTPLHWRAAYESGNTLIDGQHRDLFRAANLLIVAAEAGHDDLMFERLDELITRAISHFREEEELLVRAGAPEYREHRNAHAKLLERVLTVRHQLAEDRSGVERLIRFLTHDLIGRHMIDSDRRFFDSLRP